MNPLFQLLMVIGGVPSLVSNSMAFAPSLSNDPYKNCNHLSPSSTSSTSFLSSKYDDEDVSMRVFSRRDVLKSGGAIIGAAFFTVATGASVVAASSSFPSTANAFENKISTKYDDRPKRRGPKPKDLGVSKRLDIVGEEYQGLKHCGAAPNCFVSTDNVEDDPDHNIPAWTWPEEYGNDGTEKAFQQLVSTIESYEPGQSNVDGGGFKIITNESSSKRYYVYAQFESLKNGYIDDVEFALIDGFGPTPRSVQIRSSSRIGYLDFGVNAKRLNYIAKELRSKGWDAPGVEYKSHQNYVIQNELQ